MNFKTKLAVLAIGAAMGSMAFNASACSTVIVGKDASATGNILVGHNEDNGGRILTAQHWVPAATHKAGEMIKFEEAAASIPQVEKTFGFFWSQTFDPTGASFSDGFVNENGVTIVTNACTGIYKDDIMPTKDGGIGYGIRRLMAERATSARHAVDIAIELLGKYGYFSEGRTYTIADPNEAWQLAIHQGNTWVARRVQDNEIIYIPNNFMMDKVDATDTKNVIVAPGMIERAINEREHRPMFIVDLAVPRDVEPEIDRLDDVYVYTVDDLGKVVNQGMASRQAAITQAETIISLRMSDFAEWLRQRETVPFIQSLRDRAHLLAEAELARALRHLHHGDSPEEVLQMLAYGLTNKLTHDPTILLRNGEGLDDEDRDLMERLLNRFYRRHDR